MRGVLDGGDAVRKVLDLPISHRECVLVTWLETISFQKRLSFKGLVISRCVIVIKINICIVTVSIMGEWVALLHRISGVPVAKFRPPNSNYPV